MTRMSFLSLTFTLHNVDYRIWRHARGRYGPQSHVAGHRWTDIAFELTQRLRDTDVMITITVKWNVKEEHAVNFLNLTKAFTDACRAESGCLWFDWSRSCENLNEYVLIEAYRDSAAGEAHVNSDHFKVAMDELGQYLVARPQVISYEIPQDGWSQLGEITMPDERASI